MIHPSNKPYTHDEAAKAQYVLDLKHFRVSTCRLQQERIFRIVQKQHNELWRKLIRACVCFCNMDIKSLRYFFLSQRQLEFVCICIQSFIYSHFMKNYYTLYSIQIKCFLTNSKNFVNRYFI